MPRLKANDVLAEKSGLKVKDVKKLHGHRFCCSRVEEEAGCVPVWWSFQRLEVENAEKDL